MGIWKWMRNTAYSPLAVIPLKNRSKLPVVVLVCLLCSGQLVANPSFGFRIMPGYYLPLGDSLLQSGFGSSAKFDFLPVSYFGLFVEGEYISIGLKNVAAIPVMGGSLGGSFLWSPKEKLTLRADLMGGLYSIKRSGISESGISAGSDVSATYQITPVISASLQGGYKYYAYRPDPFMNAAHVGLSVSIDLSEAFGGAPKVSAVTEKQEPVFPVSYTWYDDNKLAMVKITNNESNTITDVTTSFYLEQYMGQPKLCKTIASLKPGESVEVPITALFNESMLELTTEVDAQAKLIIEYRKLGSKRTAEIPMTIPIYDRNSMNWDDDRRAASFVSSKDPAALWFSKYVASIVTSHFRPGVNKNFQYAMGIFESLKSYGLNYVVDPSSSYAENEATGGSSIDFLQFPYQTLMYRGGDCDDLSILNCSLLEAIGVDSAFITIPGHIFIAFSTGMTEAEAKKNFYAPGQLAYVDGMAWVPLEITLTKDNFNKAWKVGAKEWNDANARGTARLYPTSKSQAIYKPVSVPGAASRFALPDESKTLVAFDASLDTYIEKEIRPQIQAYNTMLAKKDTVELRNRLGVLYGTYGMTSNAKEEFTIAARKKDMDGWVNLGNIAFMDGNYENSLKYFNYVLSQNPENTIALLGSARSYYELDQFRYSDALYAEVGVRDPELAKQYSYLGSFFESKGRAWSMSDRLATTTWSISDKEIPPEVLADLVKTDDGKIDIKQFLASLAKNSNSAPDIDALNSADSARLLAVREEDLLPPGQTDTSKSDRPPALPSNSKSSLMGMLTIKNDEIDNSKSQNEIKELMKFKVDSAPELPGAAQDKTALAVAAVSSQNGVTGKAKKLPLILEGKPVTPVVAAFIAPAQRSAVSVKSSDKDLTGNAAIFAPASTNLAAKAVAVFNKPSSSLSALVRPQALSEAVAITPVQVTMPASKSATASAELVVPSISESPVSAPVAKAEPKKTEVASVKKEKAKAATPVAKVEPVKNEKAKTAEPAVKTEPPAAATSSATAAKVEPKKTESAKVAEQVAKIEVAVAPVKTQASEPAAAPVAVAKTEPVANAETAKVATPVAKAEPAVEPKKTEVASVEKENVKAATSVAKVEPKKTESAKVAEPVAKTEIAVAPVKTQNSEPAAAPVAIAKTEVAVAPVAAVAVAPVAKVETAKVAEPAAKTEVAVAPVAAPAKAKVAKVEPILKKETAEIVTPAAKTEPAAAVVSAPAKIEIAKAAEPAAKTEVAAAPVNIQNSEPAKAAATQVQTESTVKTEASEPAKAAAPQVKTEPVPEPVLTEPAAAIVSAPKTEPVKTEDETETDNTGKFVAVIAAFIAAVTAIAIGIRIKRKNAKKRKDS